MVMLQVIHLIIVVAAAVVLEAAGSDGPAVAPGGAGVQVGITGPAAYTTGVGALRPASGQYQWFAGGGGGGGKY